MKLLLFLHLIFLALLLTLIYIFSPKNEVAMPMPSGSVGQDGFQEAEGSDYIYEKGASYVQ